jgi:hypothetical protein
MSVTLFIGAFFGALLGFAIQNRHFSICKYLFEKHPTFAKLSGMVLLFGLVLIPSLALSGVITVNATPFFWGGCLSCSFIFSFFMTSCLMSPTIQES